MQKAYASKYRSADIFDLLADVVRARQEAWRDRAACKGMAYVDSEVFFPREALGGDEARKMCARCPVRAECEADWSRQPSASRHHGVWFGQSPRDRVEAKKSLAESLTGG